VKPPLAPRVSAKAGSSSIFWLVFKQGDKVAVILQPGANIIAARMRAMLAGIVGEFQEGHELDARTAKKVSKAMVGKVLSRKEAAALLKKLDK
jgi:hypothetical protein